MASANTKNNAKESCVKNWSKVVLKMGPSMLRNRIGPIFNTTVWSFNFCLFFENPLLSAGSRILSKTKNKKQLGPILTQKRAYLGPILTLQHVCLCLSVSLPFGPIWDAPPRTVSQTVKLAMESLYNKVDAVLHMLATVDKCLRQVRIWLGQWLGLKAHRPSACTPCLEHLLMHVHTVIRSGLSA